MVHKRALARVNTQQTSTYTILKHNAILANTHQGSLQENMFIESKCSTVNMFVRDHVAPSLNGSGPFVCLFVFLLLLNKFKKDC